MKLNEKGAAALLAIVGVAIIFLLVMTGFFLAELSGKLVAQQLKYQGQAMNTAEAGLTEALSYLRRQNTQPVTVFSPQLNPGATPPLNETDDPTIGIVRSFTVSKMGTVGGRYEVRYQDMNQDGTVQPNEQERGAQDISARRGLAAGTVWQVESVGIISTNGTDIVKRVLRTEMRRLAVTLPAPAAISNTNGNNLHVNASTRVRGLAGVGVAYPLGAWNGGGTVTGGSATSAAASYPIDAVFGMTAQELVGVSDTVIAAPFSNWDPVAQPLATMGLSIIQDNATFDSTNPLSGSGIIVVFGNLTIAGDSNSNWNGLIYVTGNFTMNAPSLVSGSVVCLGTVTLNGSGDFSEVDFSQDILNQIQRQMGQYRMSRVPYIVPLSEGDVQ